MTGVVVQAAEEVVVEAVHPSGVVEPEMHDNINKLVLLPGLKCKIVIYTRGHKWTETSELSTVHEKVISGLQGQIILRNINMILLREPILSRHPVLSGQ